MKLEKEVLQWARDRKILENSSPETQMLKLVSEVGELADNLAKEEDVADSVGDCLVVLTIIANMKGLSLEQCLEVAYNDIKDRTGYLTKDGVFVKQLTIDFDAVDPVKVDEGA